MTKTKTKDVAAAEMRIYGESAGGFFRVTPLAEAVRAHDQAFVSMEAKWGIDVLPSLVAPETAAKFARACSKRDEAIREGTDDEAIAKLAVVVRGLAAMEAEAEAAGHTPAAVSQWRHIDDDGTEWIFVHTHDEAKRLVAAGEKAAGRQIWSLPEVVRMLSASSLVAVLKAKDMMPQAEIVAARRRSKSEELLDDEIPF